MWSPHIPGKVIWHDLLTDDVESARHFYGELFGWKFESPTPGQNSAYTLITLNGSRIGGMIDATKIRADVDLTQWVSILSVDDVDAATEFVRTSGGTVFTEPTDLTDRIGVEYRSSPIPRARWSRCCVPRVVIRQIRSRRSGAFCGMSCGRMTRISPSSFFQSWSITKIIQLQLRARIIGI
jgi:predicted enzyme related to lactoylglutathione lyase